MLTFVLLSLLSVILLLLWLRQTGKPNKQSRDADSRIYAAHTQSRPLEPLEHSTGQAFGLLLKAARGDRAQVEKWITAAQQQSMPPLDRDRAIAELAQRLQASRR
ncbi:hypothetical protein [Aquitalea sp. LB_tupeE]|uniref:hypothetical protein n=1 Tax=Aquitalea sp. LB_tupeE TaxID=2748078 RepID=UPI0015C00BA3|nr:hypothetical protein [Aquitalea sp. LB_tupeE]NWK77530.1 hypothetical protein [Aquitalea sp. LB_tupeE]